MVGARISTSPSGILNRKAAATPAGYSGLDAKYGSASQIPCACAFPTNPAVTTTNTTTGHSLPRIVLSNVPNFSSKR
jgi:hypothetical protein